MAKTYKNGLMFSSPLDRSLKAQYKRVTDKKASMIIIEGGLGLGKTTLLIHILDYINGLVGLPKTILKSNQYAMGGEDFQKKIPLCYRDKLPAIGYDEGGDFSGRGALTKFNAMLNRTFETYRVFKCVVIIVLPSFLDLDKSLFKKRIPRLLITIKNRTNKSGHYQVRNSYRMNIIRREFAKNPYNLNYAYFKSKPNYYGHFKDLEKTRSNELDKITTELKLAINEDSIKKNEKIKENKLTGLYTTEELKSKLNRGTSWLYYQLKNIKCTEKIGTRKYYSEEVFKELKKIKDIKGDTRRDL